MEKDLKQDTTSVPNNGAPSADERLLEYYQPAAECFRKAWEGLADDVLLTLMEDIQRDGGTFTRLAAKLIFTFPPLQELAAELSREERSSLLIDLTLALTTSVVAEFIRRVELSETKGGGITRKWAVGGELTTEDTTILTRSAQFRTRYNSDDLGESKKEENSSIILLACAQLLNEDSIPTANSRAGLAKLISGWFNSVPRRADDILREHVRKNLARKRKTEQVDSQVDSSVDQDGRKMEKAFRVEWHPERENWILLANIQSLETLTPSERQVIDFIHQGSTQKEIAEKLKVSQPRITQLKASAIKKIKQAQLM